MLDNAKRQGAAVLHSALFPITAEFKGLWRPSGYILITRQKSLGRNHPFLKGESPSVIQSLLFSLLNLQFSAMQASSSMGNP